ncbi:MAG: hypothetical protein AB8H86_16845 [Polyangiales bacterium]
MKTLLTLLASLCLLSCGQPLTQIVLEVNSDIPEDDVGPILITVRGASGELGVEYTANFAEPNGPSGFPITLSLVLADDAEGDSVSVVVRADRVGGSDSVEASAETQFVPDSTRALGILLDTACIEIPCDAGDTCRGGVCVSNQVDGETLPVFSE